MCMDPFAILGETDLSCCRRDCDREVITIVVWLAMTQNTVIKDSFVFFITRFY